MIFIVVLVILTIILYGVLFSNFGFSSGLGQSRSESDTRGFLEDVPSAAGGQPAGPSEKENIDSERNSSHPWSNRGTGAIVYNIKNGFRGDNAIFDDVAFLRLSESAIVAVMEAFSERKLDILRNMLTEDLFRTLAEKINSSREHLNYRTVVVSFDEKVIEKRQENRGVRNGIIIDLRVVMNQINYVEDENHNIVYGSRDSIEKISEIWTFVLSCQENGQNRWLVKSIGRC
jgi:predicted lipid-binding transport protein (Tim44 family)